MNDTEPGESAATTAIGQIIDQNERIRSFWHEQAGGWAPRKAATLLENSRLDRLVSLSHNLLLWTQPFSNTEDEGRLILAWANLGILVEGTMTWFLCVWEDCYSRTPMRTRNGDDLEPNRLRFEELIRFYRQHIWVAGQEDEWDGWLTMVRERRNAVHAFNHRELGTWDEYWQAVVRYADFVAGLDLQVPYPEARDYQ
jgi:hypothetical protein